MTITVGAGAAVSFGPPPDTRTEPDSGAASFGAGLTQAINQHRAAPERTDTPDAERRDRHATRRTATKVNRKDNADNGISIGGIAGVPVQDLLLASSAEAPGKFSAGQAAALAPRSFASQQSDMAAGSPPQANESQDSAFAVRLQAASSPDFSGIQAELAGAGAAGLKKALEAMEGSASPDPSTVPMIGAAASARNEAFGLPAAEQESAPAPIAQLHTSETTDQPKPLNSISLQVGEAGAQKVLVRVVQEPGEVRLAVRTSDPELARGLQQGLTELVGKLQESGYRAEAWKPVQTAAQTPPAAESQSSPSNSRHGDGQAQPGGSNHNNGERNHPQSNRPRWVEELETSLSSGPNQGESYGFSS